LELQQGLCVDPIDCFLLKLIEDVNYTGHFSSAGASMSNTKSAVATPIENLEFPAASPSCSYKQRVGLTDVEVTYSRPGAKGRQVFGSLVPYGKLWRAGANQATKISFTTPVKMNGVDIAAGAYSLFAIPEKEEWTLILNKDTEQGGTGKYDEKLDVARFKAKSAKLDHHVENYTIDIDAIEDESATLGISWEKTKVNVKLELNFIDNLVSRVDTAMASDMENKPYFQAALLYFNHGKDLKKAHEWVDAAIAQRPIYPFYLVKAYILAKLGDKTEALAIGKKASELATQADDAAFLTRINSFLSELG
jgi:hypothetical protein